MAIVFAGQSQGRREAQEDAYRIDPPQPTDPGSDVLLVLADGMGGHAAGEIASKLAVETFVNHFASGTQSRRPLERLNSSLQRANEAIAENIRREADLKGMGCTLIGCLKMENRLVWVSVGDSILFLVRRGEIRRLNADHSVYGEMMELVAQRKISQTEADRHPRRNALRSAVIGGDMPLVDLSFVDLERGDVVVMASDGIETLPEQEIAGIVRLANGKGAAGIGEALLHSVERSDDPNQDNTTVVVYRHDTGGSAGGVVGWFRGLRDIAPAAIGRTPVAALLGLAALAVLATVLGLWILRQAPEAPEEVLQPLARPAQIPSDGGRDLISPGSVETPEVVTPTTDVDPQTQPQPLEQPQEETSPEAAPPSEAPASVPPAAAPPPARDAEPPSDAAPAGEPPADATPDEAPEDGPN